jgi:hypothetical protein
MMYLIEVEERIGPNVYACIKANGLSHALKKADRVFPLTWRMSAYTLRNAPAYLKTETLEALQAQPLIIGRHAVRGLAAEMYKSNGFTRLLDVSMYRARRD